ncbi:NAD(P)H-dependent oxidoreductase [Shimia sp. MMG029]|uniref:NAD(P)H-dependent oxidoreductase n=1 Tax=Shimia sp. MMG029 TaxID=3021978 RepID=UPI0022FDBAAD|nr:NAD(P)H-dependent oxidoreductase [Shimia sp. MMG029]MDA5556590.1 NAD(P)H-dependent oxidoreductase [Shimia sp. MMG029]
MHVLTVLDHPTPSCFSATAAARFIAGLRSAGHTAELADLNAEGFNPLWSLADIAEHPAEDVQQEQERMARADAICLIFPLYWWGLPAKMKGWVNRVWQPTVTANDNSAPDGAAVSAKQLRAGLMLVPAGPRTDRMDRKGHAPALDTSWMMGAPGAFGTLPDRLELLIGSASSDARHAQLQQRCFDIGQTLPAPASQRTC